MWGDQLCLHTCRLLWYLRDWCLFHLAVIHCLGKKLNHCTPRCLLCCWFIFSPSLFLCNISWTHAKLRRMTVTMKLYGISKGRPWNRKEPPTTWHGQYIGLCQEMPSLDASGGGDKHVGDLWFTSWQQVKTLTSYTRQNPSWTTAAVLHVEPRARTSLAMLSGCSGGCSTDSQWAQEAWGGFLRCKKTV